MSTMSAMVSLGLCTIHDECAQYSPSMEAY
jgi:hypothetical protein